MSFPRYPKYKDSGVEWLGEVPEHWWKTSLKYLADYQNGFPFKPDDWGTEGLPIIRISQLTGDSEPNYFAGTLDDRVRVDHGDLLFSWSATIDSYFWANGPAWLNQHIFKVTPSEEADQGFLFYLIKHVAPKLADFDAHGSTMRHIKKESLGERAYVPALHEQRLIGRFLDRETAKIDELVAEQQRLMELLKEKRQAVISHAVTKGLNPDAPMKPSGVEWLGEVPAHWDIEPVVARYSVQLGKMLDTARITGKNLRPYLRVIDVQWGAINTDDLPMMDFAEYARDKFLLRPGDLLVNEGGSYPGRCAIWIGALGECYYQKALHRLRPLKDRTDSTGFFYYLMNWAANAGVFTAGGNEATIEHLPAEKLRRYRFGFPSITEQLSVAEFLDVELGRFDELLTMAGVAIGLLSERRSALISAAVTGQIDVRTYAID